MRFVKIVALGLAALIAPALLALATYVISASSFDAPAGAVPRLSGRIATPRPTESPTPKASPRRTNGDDVSGPCDEAEHADDPRCTGEATGGTSGPGDDGDAGDDDSSGPGSDNSGPGSDNSGPGSDESDSGSDNSGPGSDSSGPGSGGSDDSGDSGGDD